jgi:hypothetical protein
MTRCANLDGREAGPGGVDYRTMRRLHSKTTLLVGSALCLSAACAGDFDDRRKRTEPIGTLGEDIFGALCDRVGASVLTEDVYGTSYHRVCHRDTAGQYADQVDQTKLPPIQDPLSGSGIARTLAIAKVEAMARRRKDLVQALDATFSDDPMPDPFHPGKTVPGHTALKRFLQRIVPLYETNPVDKHGSGSREALMPSVTRATGRLFASLAGPGKGYGNFGDEAKAQKAQLALSRLSGRLGYRPLRVALGAIKPSMAYPELRQLAQTFAPRLRPPSKNADPGAGLMRDAFQNVLGMASDELSTSLEAPLPVAYALTNAAKLQPNRPRTNSEVARAIMLSTDPAFAKPGAVPQYLVVRDSRGYAVPAGNQPGVPGTVPAAFVDGDGDGFADVDSTGRFLGPAGLAQVDTPFFVPGLIRVLPPDGFGRAVDPGGAPLYSYLDTSQTFIGSTTRDLEPLLNPDPTAESEALADLLSGAYALYGDPIQNKAPWAVGGVYQTFDTAQSPLVDLAHATGWMFAHENSDVHLKMVKKLFTDHEQVMARLIGASLKIREASNARPEAKLDPTVTLWDELQEIIVATAADPALFKDVLRSLAHPDTQAYLGSSYSKFAQFKDALYYDTQNLNGPPVNLTDASNPEPHVPPDYGQPDVGENRSDFLRILQIIHDVNGVNACNKEGAKVKALGITIPGSFKECELFYFENMGLFYLSSILNKANLKVRSGFLNLLLQIGGVIGLDPDGVFEDGSGIDGMTRKPTAHALNRLVFFGAQSTKFDPLFGGTMPDRDKNWNGKNGKTNEFVSLLVEPVSTAVCPERLVNVPGATASEPSQLWLADCSMAGSDPNDVLRIRGKGTIFLWEKYEFYKGMRPILKAFDDHAAGQIFLDSVEALYRHWPTEQHGPECNASVPAGYSFADRPWQKYLSKADATAHKVNPAYNAKWCNGSGGTRYDPVLVDAFAGDIIPALGELVKVLDDPNFVTDDRNGGVKKSGLDVLHEMTVAMMDPAYASKVGMLDRFGGKTAKWANGQITKPQLSMFDLFADAMAKIDARLVPGSARFVRWKRARSKLVDQFLTVDGEGTNAQFKNQAFIKSVPILLDVLREQINANCPDRETNPSPCKWATLDLGQKTAESIGGQMFGTSMFLMDLINEDEEARRALEKHLRYLVQEASTNDAMISMLASSADMMQILSDDENMPAIYNAVATAAGPEDAVGPDGKPAPGTADRVFELLDALTTEPGGQPNPYDPYRFQDRMLANLVTPLQGNPENLTPIEIFLDTFAEVHRLDAKASPSDPLSPDDLKVVFATMRDFLTSKSRGMEQLYEIMSHRNGD